MSIPRISRDKAVGDLWTTGDADSGPRFSELTEEAGRKEHTAGGEHLLPAPEAAGYLEWSGSAYSVKWGEGIKSVTQINGGAIPGEILIELDNLMVPETIAAFWTPVDETISAAVLGNTGINDLVLRFFDDSSNPVDRSGLLQIYGERL